MSAAGKCPQCGAELTNPAFEGCPPKCIVQVLRKIPTAIVITEKPDDKIGHYKLLQQLGEGGCGVVYMAEQTEPVRRKVALKVINLGMATKQVVARFKPERQALAPMDHPNIAKVFDAGATGTGQPFFVMELVRGIKITDYRFQQSKPPMLVVAREGANGYSQRVGSKIWLFKRAWENPRPDVEIQSIDCLSRTAEAAPSLIASRAE